METCSICLEENFCMVTRNSFCSNDKTNGESCCENCLKSYIASMISSAFKGSCPVLYCPLCVGGKDRSRCILKYSYMTSIQDERAQYEMLAESLLSLQCGGCHKRKSMHVVQSREFILQAKSELLDITDLQLILGQYETGKITISDCFQTLTSICFPSISMISDTEAWKIMRNVLLLIDNPERRSNLHLRYLRTRPRVWTYCCRTEQCFRCRTKTYHEGKTCEEVLNLYDNTIITCLQCGVHLVKGDGCDSVFCVCGTNFSWSQTQTKFNQSNQFVALYPSQTAANCARTLCEASSLITAPVIELARSWSLIHPVEISCSLRNWWGTSYAACPSQCAIVLPDAGLNTGVKQARKAWVDSHSKEIMKCNQQRIAAQSSLASTWFQSDDERLYLVYHADAPKRSISVVPFLSSYSDDVRQVLTSQIRQEIKGGKEVVEEFYWRKKTDQFLALFGNRQLSLVQNTAGIEVNITNGILVEEELKKGDKVMCAMTCALMGSRSAEIIDINENGTFQVQFLKSAVPIIAYNVVRSRISRDTNSRIIFMTPSLAMSNEQIEMFRFFTKYLKSIHKHQPQGAEGAESGGRSGSMQEVQVILKVLLQNKYEVPDDDAAAHLSTKVYLSTTSSNFTWNDIFHGVLNRFL